MLDGAWDHHAKHRVQLRKARLQGSQVIGVLYDLIPLRYGGFCGPGVPAVYCEGLRSALEVATGFVCISKSVADEFLLLLTSIKFPRPVQVGYWHLGADFGTDKKADLGISGGNQSTVSVNDQVGSLPIERDDVGMFLMVGTLEPRKGHRVALDAFDCLWGDGLNAQLVIIGKLGWGAEHLARRIKKHPEYGGRLLWLERVSDAQLQSHYAAATAVIASSYAEGFGLPIVEASYFNKTVLASDIPVFREVAKDDASAIFFDVGSAQSLQAAVRQSLTEKSQGTDHGTARKKTWLSWSESAAQLSDVVEGGNWYKTYEPNGHENYGVLTDIGESFMPRALREDECAHKLKLVEGPILSGDQQSLRLVVALTNQSEFNWFSRGPGDARLGIFVSYHVLDKFGRSVEYDNPRTAIPFVHIPGDTHYLAIDVPEYWRQRGGVSVDIEMLQEGVDWWGNALRVRLF
jgi:glycosyltransferase involved in cell wall biosynthesis